ncbi:hypothetical protein [Leptolyngbya sp. 7M]|uniref:hypothetical protein n=1 Tax=Leptolyngbya sp. 7M TaxID=2812896 RepID=UPI001B8D90DA|nr:hypothetical protein [Leptolyngbya sp. 7M]QYO64598.1 hypothetical protein JVX88_34030 [Leptolyngbya sp. 7M]
MKTSLLTGLLSLSLSVIGSTVLGSISPAQAASLSFDQSKLERFNDSTPVNFNVTLDDTVAGEGAVQFKVDISQGFFADLRGIFFHIKDESLLADLNITGPSYITQVVKNANSVLDLGGGGNLNGGGSGGSKGGGKPKTNLDLDGQSTSFTSGTGGFDVGIEIGSQGAGKDDIRSASFVVSHKQKKLSLSDFAEILPMQEVIVAETLRFLSTYPCATHFLNHPDPYGDINLFCQSIKMSSLERA